MGMRGIVAAVLLCAALVAGCSSNSKTSSNVSAAGGVGLGGVPAGVTGTGSASQTVPADLAFVVAGLSSNGNGFDGINSTIIPGPNGTPISIPTENPNTKNADHKAIRTAITSLGLPAAAVEFSAASSNFDNGASVVQVEVPVARLPKIAHDVVAAIGKAGAKVSGQGLRLAVSDCAAALTSARTKALANARADAQSIADAGGVSLGQLVSVSEASPAASSVLSYFSGTNPCGRGEIPDSSGPTPRLAALDAPARVDLTESVAATYALKAATDRTVGAIGQGERSGPADAADIIVAPDNSINVDSSGTPTTTTGIDEAAVVRAVRPFGVEEKDVEVENPPSISLDGSSFSGSAYIRVHVTIPQLTKSGHQIAAAIQAVVPNQTDSPDGPGTVGVLFHASNCRDLEKQARVAAAADARRRTDKLASAAHVHAGAVTGMTEPSALPYYPTVDACDFDIDNLANVGALTGSSYPGVPSLADLDAKPVVTVNVSLQMSRALSS
jgi:uncharacterized protein YggE